MPPEIRPTIRSLAKELRLSRTTVSDALRDDPRVNRATRERVQAFAEKQGYRFNPLASSILSELRRTRISSFRGVLAAISIEEPGRPPFEGPYWRSLLKGAEERAGQLGFKLERFFVGRDLSIQRLDTVLRSRGIRGVLIMPTWESPDFAKLSWVNYAGVYADYLINLPALHSVCPDHPRAMMTAMARLRDLGYRRPGLVVLEQESHRIQDRWVAAFLAYLRFHSDVVSIPPLILPTISRDAFVRWFKQREPDVVLGHRAEFITWMTECGARVPETHGFCCLNVDLNKVRCAGIDQNPYHVGAHCIEQVTVQILHNAYGIPELPCNMTVPSRWVDGPTLRTLAST